MKKTLSLVLVLAMCLGLTVPAFAASSNKYSANGYTDPATENVTFSVAPIGVATIRGEYSYEDPDDPEYSVHNTREFTAYVFDQDCLVTRKDGRPLTHFVLDDGIEGYYVNIGNENFPYAHIEVAGISAEQSWLFQFGLDSDDEADWSPWMMSQKALEEYQERSGVVDEWGGCITVVDHRTLSARPQQPETPITPTNTAYASTQTVLVDGQGVEFEMYALKNEAGNMTNYVKLRDLAIVLNGTQAQFAVGWDGVVNIETGKEYVPNGTEMQTPYSGDRTYQMPTAPTNINGEAAEKLTAFVLTDDAGNGYTYYQLRDLGRYLGFNVDWSKEKGVFVETDKPYTE